MIRAAFVLAIAAALPAVAAAQRPPEYPGLVPAFTKACMDGELTLTARETIISSDSGWVSEAPTVDVPSLAISRAIDKNFDFSKPTSVKQWARTIDGITAHLVLASFPEKRRYPAICAIVAPNVRHGWPYNDAFEASAKALGLKGKSTDLPHYFEYSGKVDNGAHPVRAEVSGRTRAVPDKDAMHLYIAF